MVDVSGANVVEEGVVEAEDFGKGFLGIKSVLLVALGCGIFGWHIC